MEMTPMQVEAPPAQPTTEPQPAFQPQAPLDEAAVRAAVMAAEARGDDPTKLSVAALVQGTPAPQEPAQPATPVEVPEKFQKPNGEVDVEKLKTSTKQLDEAIQAKEAAVQKTVEDYLAEYRAKEQKFRSMPNPAKLAATLPPPAPPAAMPEVPIQMNEQQVREILMKDFQADPIATTATLIELAIQKRMEPLEREREDNQIRQNLQALAAKDARVMQPEIFAAINAKLETSPELWKLKNPHKAAWLEVKEDLRLGEPLRAPAQPSKPAAPILGGGTPPPAPSSSGGPISRDTIAAAISQVNRHDQNQMAALDKAAKEFFDREFRMGR